MKDKTIDQNKGKERKRMDKKLNNKGFSLVEVIVVIAIIGILAVTMAPRLTQYLDKARQASDQEVVNTIYTAAKLADISNPIKDDKSIPLGSKNTTGVFKVSDDGKTWTLNESSSISDTDGFTKEFFVELMKTIDSFTLKSTDVEKATSNKVETQIYIGKKNNQVYVVLDYNGDGKYDYKVPDHVTTHFETASTGG